MLMKKVIYKCRNIHRFSDRKNVKLFAAAAAANAAAAVSYQNQNQKNNYVRFIKKIYNLVLRINM